MRFTAQQRKLLAHLNDGARCYRSASGDRYYVEKADGGLLYWVRPMTVKACIRKQFVRFVAEWNEIELTAEGRRQHEGR